MISRFEGEFRFLSNFFRSPILVWGWELPTVEHGFQLLKFRDVANQQRIADCVTASEARQLGRRLSPLRSDWTRYRLNAMRTLLQQKFASPHLRTALLNTGDEELVEGNTWNDTFWGVCRDRGSNHLGLLLMEIRGELAS